MKLVRKRLWHSARKRLFYYKLITYTLLVSLLPISVISPLFYHNAKQKMQQELQLAGANYLKMTVNAMEIVASNIAANFRQLSLDQVIRDFESFPLGAYYESLNGAYPDDDLLGLYNYLDRKARLLENLRALKLSNEFIWSVYYYDTSKQMVMTWDLMQYKPESFYDPGWDQFTESIDSFPAFMEMRKAKQPDGSVKDVIPIVYMSLARGNYLVINLDAASIYNRFVSKLDNKTDSALFVLSKAGKLMLYEKNKALSAAIEADLQTRGQPDKARHFSYENDYGGRNMLVTGISSDTLGWTFVTATALDDMYRSVSYIKSIIMLITFLLVVATGLLVFMTTRNIYHPIRHLLQFIRVKDAYGGAAAEGKGISELTMIRSSLEGAYEDRSSLQVRLLESMPASQEKFVRTLLRKHAIGRDEMAERLRYLDLHLELDGLMLLLIAIEPQPAESPAESAEVVDMNKLRLVDLIGSAFARDSRCLVVELSEGVFIALVNCAPHDFQAHFLVAEGIIRDARETIGIRCSIGIGKYCGDYLELPRAYEEAREALRYRTIVGICEVIYIEDVRLVNTPLFVYPKDKEAALVNYIINGETESARRVLADMMRDIRSQQNKAHYRQVQHAFIQILGSLAGASNDLRLDLDKLMAAETNLYSALLQKNDDWQAVAVWFDEMVVKLTAHIDHAFQEKNNKHVDEVMRMIERDYGEQMSLTAAADRLGLNPSYLSRIFKEKNGESFSEYLTGVRIGKSKALLVGTEMKIKDIGEAVGYYKTNYFIKLFKEYTGMTPGEYRKLHVGA